MPVALPTQLSGARFLADRQFALLADEERVGKTGAAIIAADYVFAQKILVVTTTSGRAVWRRGFAEWSTLGRKVQILGPKDKLAADTDVAVVAWGSIADPVLLARLLWGWDLLIGDEAHYAKNFEAKRTQAFYGRMVGHGALVNSSAIAKSAKRVWLLTATPIPNSPGDLFPMLRALAPERIDGLHDQEDFLNRYTVRKPKKLGNWPGARTIMVPVKGRNEAELAQRLEGLWLRRTQKDVGITSPVHEIFPLLVSDKMVAQANGDLDRSRVLAAAQAGDTKALDMQLGPIRRLTGEFKARAVVEAVKEEFDCGLDKIVLMHWHTDVGRILREGLGVYGVVGIDGSTLPRDRAAAEERFRSDPSIRVFVGQIQAAGEAIDLSAAAELMFVETSTVPKDMSQASKRITNHGQTRQPRVRVAVLEGSIDEALQAILLRKWSTIREVLNT
jgi:SWI/SNF-related matrix-associated actin-dependent regulator 1 of chromatin subfamily A